MMYCVLLTVLLEVLRKGWIDEIIMLYPSSRIKVIMKSREDGSANSIPASVVQKH